MNNFIDKIHLGKWEDIVPNFPSSFIDLIITSPPYNVSLGIGNKHKQDSYDSYDDNMPYKDYLRWMFHLFAHCNRILKSGGRMAINIGDGNNGSIPTHADFTYMLLNMEEQWSKYFDTDMSVFFNGTYEPYKMMTTIVWDKNQIGASTAWGSWLSPSCPSFPTQFEFIIVVAKGTTKKDGDKNKISLTKDNFIRNSRALWKFTPETSMMKNFDHPAVFPEELPRRLIDQLSYQGDIVFDPFSGSGTTCSVAKKMNRRYIGTEMSNKYHGTSIDRISNVPTLKEGDNGEAIPSWIG